MLPLSFRFSSLVVLGALGALTVVACGNISLSSMNAGAGFEGPTGINDSDAAVDGGANGLATSSDAGAGAPAVVTGNPLCNYGFVDNASHNCLPDSVCSTMTADSGTDDVPAQVDSGAPGGGGASDDAGAPTGSDAGAPPPVDAAPAPAIACHVTESDAGAWTTQACLPVGAGGEGAQCQVSTDCQATYECVGMPGQCRHYCCKGNSACSATSTLSFCDVQPVVTGEFNVPVCMPVSGCSLFGKCPPNETCAIVEDDGTTSCVNIGTAKVGDPCDEVHCGAGLTCLGNEGSRTCSQLCHVDSTTECAPGTACTGSAQLFKDPQFGICQ